MTAGPNALAQSAQLPDLARIPAGDFLMGSKDGATWEQPVHRVALSALSIAKRPVTNAEFRAFRGDHENSGDRDDAAAVTGISWEDANDYCRWLSERTGRAFRLPSEAEWERAARGGLDQKPYPWGDEPPVPSEQIDNKQFQPPARANRFGIFVGVDGLWEWTADWYQAAYYEKSPGKDPRGPEQGEFRVLRGGGYRGDLNSIRCANRGSSRPKAVSDIVTFRVVLEGSQPPTQVTRAAPTRKTPKTRTTAAAARPARASRPSRPARAGGPTALRDVTRRAEAGGVVISLAIDPAVPYKTMTLSGPDRFVIDLPGAKVQTARKRSIDVNRGGVKKVRWALFQGSPPITRVVLDLVRPMTIQVEAGSNELLLKPQR